MGKFTDYSNFESFSKVCKSVYKNFKLYGESVLKVEFADSDEKEKKLLQLFRTVAEDSFEEEIKKFWKDNYILVIDKPSDFNKLPYYYHLDDDIFMCQHCAMSRIQISDDFYKRLYASKQYVCSIVCARDDEYLYIVQLNKEKGSLRLKTEIPLSKIVTE